VIIFIQRFNMFMVGIHPEECVEIENMKDLERIQLARSRPSIFDLKNLETLDVHFSCYEFDRYSAKLSIQGALGVLTTCGLRRMKQLKNLHFELNFKPMPKQKRTVPDFLVKLEKDFGTSANFKTMSEGYAKNKEGTLELESEVDTTTGKHFVLEFNATDPHISEWNQFNFFPDDPDIYNLSLENGKGT